MNGRVWTDSDVAYLQANYADGHNSEIAKHLGASIQRIYAKANKLGLKKSPAYLAAHCQLQKGNVPEASIAHRFKKGQVPFNKGLRRPGWHSGRMRETQFKKGARTGKAAINWKPLGTILPDHEGYLRIKVREAEHGKEATGFGNTSVWPLLHRHVWEEHNGPIPPKHIVRLKDGNRANCAIENLELITMAENARRNHWKNNLPPELAQVIMLNGALKRRIRRLNGEEQNQRPA